MTSRMGTEGGLSDTSQYMCGSRSNCHNHSIKSSLQTCFECSGNHIHDSNIVATNTLTCFDVLPRSTMSKVSFFFANDTVFPRKKRKLYDRQITTSSNYLKSAFGGKAWTPLSFKNINQQTTDIQNKKDNVLYQQFRSYRRSYWVACFSMYQSQSRHGDVQENDS